MKNMIPCDLKIAGMYCTQCEKRIQKALQNIDGIENVQVNYQKANARFEYDDKIIPYENIVKAIKDEGYTVIKENQHSFPIKGIISLITIIILYMIVQYPEILNLLASSRLANSGMGYGTLFLIGLTTSIHCIAMCGGINLSQNINSENIHKKSFTRPLLYNFGRLLSYAIIGGILGMIGYLVGGNSIIAIPFTIQGIIKMTAGIILLVMGLRLLGTFRWMQKFSLPFLKEFLRIFGKASTKAKTPFVIGLLNGFMPCAPLQAMGLIAFVSGNPLRGAVSMLVFRLGTMPLMLGLGTIVVALGKKFAHAVQSSGALVVTVMGLVLLTQGGVLSGIMSVVILSANAEKDKAFHVDGVQIVESELPAGSYPEITVQSSVPVRWNIRAKKKSINGCNNTMICNVLDLQYELHEGDNVIEFTPTQTGDIDYSCWMGMIYGKIHVVK